MRWLGRILLVTMGFLKLFSLMGFNGKMWKGFHIESYDDPFTYHDCALQVLFHHFFTTFFLFISFEYSCHYLIDDGASCGTGMFRCSDGKCIQQLAVCNYQKDCENGEDEMPCRKFVIYSALILVLCQFSMINNHDDCSTGWGNHRNSRGRILWWFPACESDSTSGYRK